MGEPESRAVRRLIGNGCGIVVVGGAVLPQEILTEGITMQKVLLVGGAGYVGSVLAYELLQRGYAVKILDRLYFGDDGLRDIRDRVQVVEGDMRVMDAAVLKDVDGVVNVGGLSNDPTA